MLEKPEALRKFLVGHANINGGKTVIFFFSKSNKEGKPLGPPVKVSFSNMTIEKEGYQYGHSVYAKTLTSSFCEKIIRFSRERNLNVFFSVPALFKNTRRHDDFMGLGCAFLDDVPADLSGDLFSKGFRLGDFPFAPSIVIQTSPGNYQVLWNFKGFLPADERYRGPQPSFLPASSKHRKELFNRMLNLLKKRLGGDPGGSNPNQIYRVPFTLNHKPKYSPAPEVELLYSDFSPGNRIKFSAFYTELLFPELKKHYQDEFSDVFSKLRENNDWIIIDNLLGWGESADDLGRSWTANERDLSVAKRLYKHYKIPRETVEKIIQQSPNRQKGQAKGEKYINSLFSKLKKQPNEKSGQITPHRRTTIDILRIFGEAGSLLFSRQPKVIIDIPVENGRVEVWRTGLSGMSRSRGKVLMWSLSEAKKKIDISFDIFMEKILEMKVSDYKNERAFRKTAYKTFDRLAKALVSFRLGIGGYYGLDLNSSSKVEGISPFKSFERTKNNRAIIELSSEMDKVLVAPERLKRISKRFLSFIEQAQEPLTPPLLLWIGETFYNWKNANTDVVISSEELSKRLKGTKGKNSDRAAKQFRDDLYKAIKEINKNNLLELVGTNARKISVASTREASNFTFAVSHLAKKAIEG